MRFWITLFSLLTLGGYLWVADAHCAGCPGWPCTSSAQCDTGSGCACSGSGTGPGVCVGGR